MFAHSGMLTLKDDMAKDSAILIQEGLLALVGHIPGLVHARVGVSAEVNAETATLLFIMEFDSEESWRLYGDHPAHKALVIDAIAPALADKRFFQTRSWQTKALV